MKKVTFKSKSRKRTYKKRTFGKRKRTAKRRPSMKYRKRSYKKRYRIKGTVGKTKGAYSKLLNPLRLYRREIGKLKSMSPGNTISVSVTVGTPVTYSIFFVGNTTNQGIMNTYLPASFNMIPPDGLQEEVYANYYQSMVMYHRLGIKITKADQNADYGPVRFLLTPIKYDDYSTCLTSTPSTTTVWVGSTPQAKYSNQHAMPHSTSAMINGATSSGIMNNCWIQNSIKPGYIFTQPSWETTADADGRLAYAEQTGVGISYAADRIIWCLTCYFERPTTTSTVIFTADVYQTWKVKAWEPVPAFLITENKEKKNAAVPAPEKPHPLPERKEDDEMSFERLNVSTPKVSTPVLPPLPPRRR